MLCARAVHAHARAAGLPGAGGAPFFTPSANRTALSGLGRPRNLRSQPGTSEGRPRLCSGPPGEGGGVRTAGRGSALALQTAAPPAPARPAGILICACVRLNICCGPAWLCECTQRATCLELAKRARRRRLDVERWLKFVDELHSQRHAACRSRPRAAVHPATQRRIVQLQHSTHDNVHALSRNHRCPNPQTSSSVPVHSLQHKWGLTFDT